MSKEQKFAEKVKSKAVDYVIRNWTKLDQGVALKAYMRGYQAAMRDAKKGKAT